MNANFVVYTHFHPLRLEYLPKLVDYLILIGISLIENVIGLIKCRL